MNFFLPKNTLHIVVIGVLCIVYAILYALAFGPLLSFSVAQLMLDGLLDALFFVGLSLLLWRVVKYGNFESLDFYQQFINYSAMAILMVLIWNGVSYGVSYLILDSEHYAEVAKILPAKIFIAFLIYIIVVQTFRTRFTQTDAVEVDNDDVEEVLTQPEIEENQEVELLDRIVIKSGQKLHVIRIPEIIYFQAEGDYVRIFTDSDKFLKEETMKYFQAHLPEDQFVRAHRSYLVNISKIRRIELYEKQNQQLTMSNGDKIKISASGYKRLRETLSL